MPCVFWPDISNSYFVHINNLITSSKIFSVLSLVQNKTASKNRQWWQKWNQRHRLTIIERKSIILTVLNGFGPAVLNKRESCDTNWAKGRKKHDRHLSMKTIKYKESSWHRNVKTKRHVYIYKKKYIQQTSLNLVKQNETNKKKRNYSQVTDIRKAPYFHIFLRSNRKFLLFNEISHWTDRRASRRLEVKVSLWLFTSLTDSTAQWCCGGRRHWLFLLFLFFSFLFFYWLQYNQTASVWFRRCGCSLPTPQQDCLWWSGSLSFLSSGSFTHFLKVQNKLE